MIPDKTTYKIVADYDGKKYDFSFSNIIPSGYVMRVTDLDAETYQESFQKIPYLGDKWRNMKPIHRKNHIPHLLYSNLLHSLL